MRSDTRTSNVLSRFSLSSRELAIYIAVVLVLGSMMNSIGKLLAIAEFKYWWQVGTCYVGYVLPVALLVRHMRPVDQLVFGLIAMVPLELTGYALGTSIAFPDNLLERVLGMRNFTLAMVILVAPIPLCVNWIVERVGRSRKPEISSAPREESLSSET
jgi:hypothetical protein